LLIIPILGSKLLFYSGVKKDLTRYWLVCYNRFRSKKARWIRM